MTEQTELAIQAPRNRRLWRITEHYDTTYGVGLGRGFDDDLPGIELSDVEADEFAKVSRAYWVWQERLEKATQ